MLLHLKQNPEIRIEDSVAYVKQILDEKLSEFLELVLMDEGSKIVKQLHLSAMKTFRMFFNSRNLYDTKAELFDDIKKAIYVPLLFHSHSQQPRPSSSDDLRRKLPPLVTTPTPKTSEIVKTTSACIDMKIKAYQPTRTGLLGKARSSSRSIIIPKFGGQTLLPRKCF